MTKGIIFFAAVAAAALPLSALSGWAETPTLFLMTFGRECRFAIPKRLMAPGQEEALRARLSGFLKQG